MVGMAGIDITEYYHSKVHMAVLTRNYDFLNELLSTLPSVSDPSKIQTIDHAIADIDAACARSASIDNRDVPNRDTPLHLAVKLSDITSAFLLMEAGAEWNLQNEQGWTALEEAICAIEEDIMKIVLRHARPLQWAKWRRRIPLVIRDLNSIADFYAEITFQFESTVIPLVQRIAPSDTIRIWKKGGNLRADTTLASFDIFKSRRSAHTIMFLGEGSEKAKVTPGSLWMASHKSKTVKNIFSGNKSPLSEAEIEHEVSTLLEENIHRPGIDMTRAFLVPSTKKSQGKAEVVGPWKAELYHMHGAVLSLKSRQVLGAPIEKDDIFIESSDLTKDELMQLDAAFSMQSSDLSENGFSPNQQVETDVADPINNEGRGKKKWYGSFKEKCSKLKDDAHHKIESLRGSPSKSYKRSTSNSSSLDSHKEKEKSLESVYTMKFKPDLWLANGFPLEIGEILPLFDILGHKIKPIRRLKELLNTTLPVGTFPVKISFPVLPAIKVIVSFTKFELSSKEFHTPPSTPPQPSNLRYSSTNLKPIDNIEDIQDPFILPSDYVWLYGGEKKTKIQDNRRANAHFEDMMTVRTS